MGALADDPEGVADLLPGCAVEVASGDHLGPGETFGCDRQPISDRGAREMGLILRPATGDRSGAQRVDQLGDGLVVAAVRARPPARSVSRHGDLPVHPTGRARCWRNARSRSRGE